MKIYEEVLKEFNDLNQTQIHFWSSDWGSEWTPHIVPGTRAVDIAVVAGRSSKGHHPFVVVESGLTSYILAIAWSGNWRIVIKQVADGLSITVEADDVTAQVLTARSAQSGRNGAVLELISKFRGIDQHRTPRLPIEWNSWWPYEDMDINEEVILTNARIAKELGFEVVVLDAGWFGPTEKSSYWHDVRGDWDKRNSARFPSGLEVLGRKVRNIGIDFGIWLEVEALGKSSALADLKPEFPATRDGQQLGYICLGNPEALTWAMRITNSLISECGAKWLKMDFNVDPGFGCDRADHGHEPTEGLSAHIHNLYRLLDEVKKSFPDTTIENCSSGGLRWDLGMAQHVDLGFASDPDWPEHSLCTFWASSHFFPVEKLFNWVDSQWRGEHGHQKFNAESSADAQLEFALAISLLGGFGMSARLPDFSPTKRALVAKYINLFKRQFRPRYQSRAFIHHLTEQPQREGLGCRTVAFAIEADSYDPLMLVYQLPGNERKSAISYLPPESNSHYRIKNQISGEIIKESHTGEFIYENSLEDNRFIILEFESL